MHDKLTLRQAQASRKAEEYNIATIA